MHNMHKNADYNSVKRELKDTRITRSFIKEIKLKISSELFISIYYKLIYNTSVISIFV